jgi:GNS1/SUR4 family
MGSPLQIVSIVSLYLYFVLGKGQQWMKTRNAFELKAVINAYNIFQMGLNFYIFSMVKINQEVFAKFREFMIIPDCVLRAETE